MVLERAFSKKRVGLSALYLNNIFIRSAAYEGMQTQGLPNRKLIEHHVAMAKGGVGLTTVSYGAVSPDGRTFSTQMYINDRSLMELEKLAQEVHKAGGKVSMQLTHCGYFSKNKEIKKPLAPSRVFNEYGFLSGIAYSKAMTQADMDQVAEDFARSAFKLKEIGFDAVEIHMGHGYLLSQFLSPRTNKRNDAYGGPVENRSRFPLEVLNAVIDQVGSDFPVLVKLNLSDGFRGGFSLEDCKYVVQELEKGACSAVVLSGGFTSKSPFYLMRGKVNLQLDNLTVVQKRVEDFRPAVNFAIVVSRAFTSLVQFFDSTRHVLDAGGHFYAMKGKYPHSELDNVGQNYNVNDVVPIQVPDLDAERHLVIAQL